MWVALPTQAAVHAVSQSNHKIGQALSQFTISYPFGHR